MMIDDPLRWAFADRTTGRIVIGQPPNAPLLVFAGAATVAAIAGSGSRGGSIARAVQIAALTYWAVGEISSGVNPWRRSLGLAGLFYAVRRTARPATR